MVIMFYPLTLPVACVPKACENEARQSEDDCLCVCLPGYTGEFCESESALVLSYNCACIHGPTQTSLYSGASL